MSGVQVVEGVSVVRLIWGPVSDHVWCASGGGGVGRGETDMGTCV